MCKKQTALLVVVICAVLVATGIGVYIHELCSRGLNPDTFGHSGGLIQAISAFDYTNDRQLVGASHYVFVGKVIKQIGEARIIDDIPETQYAVDVILNIKGELQGTVEITVIEGAYQIGSTYVFATVYADELMRKLNQQQPIYGVFMGDSAKVICTDGNMSDWLLKLLATVNGRVRALRKAYPNEILLDAEIKHNQTYNSYSR